jgi:hypothetical protein
LRLRRGGLRASLGRRLFVRRQHSVNFAGWDAIPTFSATNETAAELAFAQPEANGLRMNPQLVCCLLHCDEPIRHAKPT